MDTKITIDTTMVKDEATLKKAIQKHSAFLDAHQLVNFKVLTGLRRVTAYEKGAIVVYHQPDQGRHIVRYCMSTYTAKTFEAAKKVVKYALEFTELHRIAMVGSWEQGI